MKYTKKQLKEKAEEIILFTNTIRAENWRESCFIPQLAFVIDMDQEDILSYSKNNKNFGSAFGKWRRKANYFILYALESFTSQVQTLILKSVAGFEESDNKTVDVQISYKDLIESIKK